MMMLILLTLTACSNQAITDTRQEIAKEPNPEIDRETDREIDKEIDKNLDQLCGDLLDDYATIPQHITDKLKFVGCEIIATQELVRATYQVNNADSVAVENFLVTHYQMSPMTWGTGSDGNNKNHRCHDGICVLASSVMGQYFQPEKMDKLQKINPNYTLSIKMSGYFDYIKHPETRSDLYNRANIDTFRVVVSVDDI